MVSAYILIQTEVGRSGQVVRSLKDVPGVKRVDGVTGPYDVIVLGEAADLDSLAKSVVLPVQSIDGITRTLTCPVVQL